MFLFTLVIAAALTGTSWNQTGVQDKGVDAPREDRLAALRLEARAHIDAERAKVSSGATRERHLRDAIARHSKARFENGVQVGALARAMLAVDLAGVGRFDEAERLSGEVATMFPGAVDNSGATLDHLSEGIRLLRFTKSPVHRPSAGHAPSFEATDRTDSRSMNQTSRLAGSDARLPQNACLCRLLRYTPTFEP